MDYHAKNRSEYGVFQIPHDGSIFNNIEERWEKFKEEPCNLRISLVVDGVNPFEELTPTYSLWHVFLLNNNIPLWMSIRKEHILLVMIVLCIYNLLKIFFALHSPK